MQRHKSKVSNINNLTIEQFNKLYPIGTKVNYYSIRTEKINPKQAITTSEAYILCGSKMVGLNIGRGGYCFDNIEVLDNGM